MLYKRYVEWPAEPRTYIFFGVLAKTKTLYYFLTQQIEFFLNEMAQVQTIKFSAKQTQKRTFAAFR